MNADNAEGSVVDYFFRHLDFVMSVRRGWTNNRKNCPAYKYDSGNVWDKCGSAFNVEGVCIREKCPILWE